MAGYAVTVCLPPEAAGDLRAALTAALAPFGELTDRQWDGGFFWGSWRVEGASQGHGFWIRDGHEDDPRLIHDEPLPMDGTPRLSVPGMCAGGPLGLLDLSEEPVLGRALAVEAWELWQRVAGENPPTEFPEGVQDLLGIPVRGFDPAAILARIEGEPVNQAFRAAHPLGGRDPLRWSSEIQFRPGHYKHTGQTAEQFAEYGVKQSLGGWDLLTADGWWIETDCAAHHAPCGDGCAHRPEAFSQARGNSAFGPGMYRYLQALPEDTLLVRVAGHC